MCSKRRVRVAGGNDGLHVKMILIIICGHKMATYANPRALGRRELAHAFVHLTPSLSHLWRQKRQTAEAASSESMMGKIDTTLAEVCRVATILAGMVYIPREDQVQCLRPDAYTKICTTWV